MPDFPDKAFFTQSLLHWHSTENSRELPWKNETDPYKIWLSEIILQQTRAEQGLPYYLKFTEAYPTITDLAAAEDEVVFKLWQGLGYYNRCRNMLATARIVANDYNGVFPNTYEQILALKGIGPYTAAAIASFAFKLPHAVVDGNVYRVLSRCFGIEVSSDSTEGKVLFLELANELLPKGQSNLFNQAIMDLGATVCTPAAFKCLECPLASKCTANSLRRQSDFPVRSKKVVVKTRYFNYFLFRCGNDVWLQKRAEGDIWHNLFEPYLVETNEVANLTALLKNEHLSAIDTTKTTLAGKSSQRLTHRVIEAVFYTVDCATKPTFLPTDGWVNVKDIHKYAFPKTVADFMERIMGNASAPTLF